MAENSKLKKTLGDEFAMAALPGLLATGGYATNHEGFESLAFDAYAVARAMLSEKAIQDG